MKALRSLSQAVPRTAFERRILLQQQWRNNRQQPRRAYAVQAPGAPTLEVFNPRVKYLQKERAAQNTQESRSVEYLRDEVAQRLCDRLLVRLISPLLPRRI